MKVLSKIIVVANLLISGCVGFQGFFTYDKKKDINILSETKNELNYPYDIEVTKDGKTIYFKNWYNYPKIGNSYSDYFIGNSIKEEKIKSLKRKVIYKLDTETKQISLFKIGDNPLIYNNLGYEMEIDENGNLYINDLKNYKIIKVSPSGEIVKSFDVTPFYEYEKENTHNIDSYIETPYYMFYFQNNIYYISIRNNEEYTSSDFIVNKLYLNTGEKSLVYKEENDDNEIPKLIINDNFMFFNLNTVLPNKLFDYGLQKYDLNKKELLYEKWKNISYNEFSFRSIKDSLHQGYGIVKNNQNKIFLSLNSRIIEFDIEKMSFKLYTGKKDSGFLDGNVDNALFNYVLGLAIDANDNIYVADTGNNAIRKITPDGIVSTLYKEKL
jgi:hypothetical protein